MLENGLVGADSIPRTASRYGKRGYIALIQLYTAYVGSVGRVSDAPTMN